MVITSLRCQSHKYRNPTQVSAAANQRFQKDQNSSRFPPGLHVSHTDLQEETLCVHFSLNITSKQGQPQIVCDFLNWERSSILLLLPHKYPLPANTPSRLWMRWPHSLQSLTAMTLILVLLFVPASLPIKIAPHSRNCSNQGSVRQYVITVY